jgi:hypothetical protein
MDDVEYQGEDYINKVEAIGVQVIHRRSTGRAAAHESDLFQWEVLGNCNGYYADMDILWTAPMEPICPLDQDAIFCTENGFVAIGFFGSAKCQLFRDLHAQSMQSGGQGYQHYGADAVYRLAGTLGMRGKVKGADRTVHELQRRYRGSKIVNLPTSTVYPFDWRQIDQIFEENRPIPQESVGIHWFAGSQVAQQWNNLLTKDNWYKYLSTITTAIGKLT